MMKMTRYILIGILVLSFIYSRAQDLKGIWISSHERELTKVKERFDYRNSVSIKLDSEEIDTFYRQTFLILDFINDNNLIIKGIGGHQEVCKYIRKNKKIKINTSEGKLKGIISKENIIIVDKIDKKRTNEIFFERITPSKLAQISDLDSLFLQNTNWISFADSNSQSFGFNYHFLDSNIVIISKFNSDYGYTNWGSYSTDIYKNHFFIGIIDRNLLDIYVYHFYDRYENNFIGNIYEYHPFSKSSPTLVNIELARNKLLNEQQLTELENKLSGKWCAFDYPLDIDTTFLSFLEIDTIENQKFEITFKNDKTFLLERSGEILKQSEKTFKENILTGGWEVSGTGKYIILKPNESWIKYYTINRIEDDYLEIFCEIESLYENVFISTETIKLKK